MDFVTEIACWIKRKIKWDKNLSRRNIEVFHAQQVEEEIVAPKHDMKNFFEPLCS